MRRTAALLLLILAGSRSPRTQNQAATIDQGVETVDFCDLYHHVSRYNGREVKVTATYAVGFHEATLYDERCKESPSGDHLEANAKFTEDSTETKQAFNTLSKFLKKYKASEARVTIVAVFHDDYSSGVARAGSPRYTLEVKRLLAVEKGQSPTEPNSKN
jgi:hypothetical protein